MNELILFIQAVVVFCFLGLSFWMGPYALISFITIQGILANVFVLKQISLYGMHATASDAYIIGSMIGLQLLQEYYGKALAQRAILYSFILLLFYTAVSQLTLLYVPHTLDTAHTHFMAIFQVMPRITAASIVVYIAVLFLDSLLYEFLHTLFNRKYLVVRNIISVSISQGIDTILFSFLGLYGIISNIGQVIMVSYSIKIVVAILSVPIIAIIKYYIKKTT